MNRFGVVKYMRPSTSALLLLGCGLSYVLEEKKYAHIPIVVFFPSIYCGYNIYKNREEVIKSIKRYKSV